MKISTTVATFATIIGLSASTLGLFTNVNTILQEGIFPTTLEIWSRVSYYFPWISETGMAVGYDQRGGVFVQDAHSLESAAIYAASKRCRTKSEQSETCTVTAIKKGSCFALSHRTNMGKWARRGYYGATGKDRKHSKDNARKSCANSVENAIDQNGLGKCEIVMTICND